jgi:hypothetical protein
MTQHGFSCLPIRVSVEIQNDAVAQDTRRDVLYVLNAEM